MKVFGGFEIHDSFRIQNRGIALAGKVITDGNDIRINVGDKISFIFCESEITRKIKRVEIGFVRYHDGNYFHLQNLAIEIECENELEIQAFEKWNPEAVIAKLLLKS